MSYEVVYTMSRAASPTEWDAAMALVESWLAECRNAHPALFGDSDIAIDAESLAVDLAGSEDLIVERLATTPIWSVRTPSPEAAQVLSGVLLCLQFACTAETFQLSGSKKHRWHDAAVGLTGIWGGEFQARIMAPRKHRADSLVYVQRGENARLTRDYFRANLELDDAQLPDRDFRDVLADG